jgi:threonine/homoserine/homoserine lactone efflux protein
MLDAVGQILPSAVGVALSPIPIIAVILMLFTPRSSTNGPAFLVGWVAGLSVAAAVVYSVANGADVGTDADASSGLGWGKLVLGGLLLFMAVQQWRKRPKPGEHPELPSWMTAVDHFTPVKALGTGVLLSAVNPKNLILTAAAAGSVAEATLSSGDAFIVLAVFVVLASSSVAGAIAYRTFGGDEAHDHLEDLKGWMGDNNAAVMAVILLVLGAKIFGEGLGLA